MISSTSHSLSRASARRGPTLVQRLTQWRMLHRERRALSRLDDRALADIGIDATEARAEAARPFWDAPHHWHD